MLYKTIPDTILYLVSEQSLVVAGQLYLAWLWIMQRKPSPNTDLQDVGHLRRKRGQEVSGSVKWGTWLRRELRNCCSGFVSVAMIKRF